MPRVFLLALLLAVPLVAGAWQPAPLPEPFPAPPLALDDLDGRPVTLEAFRGRLVIVNFWATWCPPCVAEMPSLEHLRETLGPERAVVLAVNVGEEPFDVALFLRQVPVALPILLDRALRAQAEWQVRVLPTTFVVDPAGTVRHREVGDRAWGDPDAVAALRELLEEARAARSRQRPGARPGRGRLR